MRIGIEDEAGCDTIMRERETQTYEKRKTDGKMYNLKRNQGSFGDIFFLYEHIIM